MSKKLVSLQLTARQLAGIQKEQHRRGKSMDWVVKQAVAKWQQKDGAEQLPQEFSQKEFVDWKKAHPKWNFDSGEKSKTIIFYKGKFWKLMFALSGAILTFYVIDSDHNGIPDVLEWVCQLFK